MKLHLYPYFFINLNDKSVKYILFLSFLFSFTFKHILFSLYFSFVFPYTFLFPCHPFPSLSSNQTQPKIRARAVIKKTRTNHKREEEEDDYIIIFWVVDGTVTYLVYPKLLNSKVLLHLLYSHQCERQINIILFCLPVIRIFL